MNALQNTVKLRNIRDLMLPLIAGKRLLDVGCIGHDYEWRRKAGTFYFADFLGTAAKVKGIDIVCEGVESAQREGYEVELANAEFFIDEGNYDVIFAGELIEHLSNPGHFLRCAFQNLTDDGILVLTTPNAFSLSRIAKCVVRFSNEPPVNPEHTCYFTPGTLNQLVTREGFVIRKLYYADYDYGKERMPWWKSMFLKCNFIFSDLLSQFSQSFVVVLGKGVSVVSSPSLYNVAPRHGHAESNG
jgi:SAM-dependent methyltransferase